MAKASVAEFNGIVRDIGGGAAQAIDWATLQESQVVSFTTSTASEAFQDGTTIIRFSADADCYFLIGADPTASNAAATTGASLYLAAGQIETWGVNAGEKIAFVTA